MKALPVLATLHVAAAEIIDFKSTGNPILADGSYYSADPAPLVVDDTFYIFSGHDTAGSDVNAFVMNDWGMFSTNDPDPAGASWSLHTGIVAPGAVFSWAEEGSAYAGQVVRGRDGRYYLYAPIQQRQSSSPDRFSIGVAVADSPLGPYTDAHPSGPIVSQTEPPPGNNIHNIDPTVLVDDDGRVFLYYGSFNQLRGYELASDMTTILSPVGPVNSLTGFFEAPWLMTRNGEYYMLYAGNNAGPDSPCTPTSYHACIAYGTASSPMGPWTFRGVALDIVSSTTSHPGAVEYNGRWVFVYHTADATGGTHFRRSVAIDDMTWDDSQSPPRINRIAQTHRPVPAAPPSRNRAGRAQAASANGTPVQYWICALNDGRIRANPLPPEYWSSYAAEQSPVQSTLTYSWPQAVELNGTSMVFFADQPAGSNIGVAPPAEWWVEYLGSGGQWMRVASQDEYPTTVTDTPVEVGFQTLRTTGLRAVLIASGSNGQYAGVGVKEWTALATTAE